MHHWNTDRIQVFLPNTVIGRERNVLRVSLDRTVTNCVAVIWVKLDGDFLLRCVINTPENKWILVEVEIPGQYSLLYIFCIFLCFSFGQNGV
jgi:hypothetical protein